MKKTMLALGAAVALVLTGCSIDMSGTVIDKDYAPGYTYPQIIPVAGANGTTTTMTIMQVVPDCYELTVRKDDGKVRKACVSYKSWDSLEIGDVIAKEAKD